MACSPVLSNERCRRRELVVSAIPIGEYALLSDRHSAALVSRAGSVDWLCLPRFDSSSVFARLLGDEAGHWSITAPGAPKSARRYVDRTMVLETTFTHADGRPDPRRTRSRWAPATVATSSASDAPHLLCGGPPAPRARSRWRSSTSPPRIRADLSARLGGRRRRHRPGRRRRPRAVRTLGARDRRLRRHRGLHVARRGQRGVRAAPLHASRPRHGAGAGARSRSASCSTTPSRHGSHGPSCTRRMKGRGAISSTRAAGCSRHCRSSPLARSAPRRPLRFPRPRAATATGTTATAGCATPASRSKRCGSRPAPTKRTSSSST